MALVTAAQAISNLPVHDGLDTEFITPIIEALQLQQLRPVMGSGFYDDMIVSGWLVDGVITVTGYSTTASGEIATMLSGYVMPFMYWTLGINALEEINNQVGNAGLVSFTPQQGENEQRAIQRKIMQWQGYKNTYQERLRQYIIDHAEQNGFEGYANNSESISGNSSSFNLLGMV